MAGDPVIIYPKWQAEFRAALAETDSNKLLERVKDAEKAISKRFGRFSKSTSHAAEIEAIEKAMDALEVLKRQSKSARTRPEQNEYGGHF